MKLEGESWAHYLAGAIGRVVNSDADSDYGREAREKLFDAYGDWCEAGRPSDDTSAEDEIARLQAALRDAAGAPGSTCTLSGDVGPEEWLRRHWRNALDNWMFWRDAYQRDIGEPDAPFPWQSWRVSAERAKAEIEQLRTDVERLDAALVQQMEDSERLRAEVAEWRRAADHNARIVADQRDQIVKLGAEIERLRAAIREHRDKRYVLAPNPQHHIDRELWEVLGDE